MTTVIRRAALLAATSSFVAGSVDGQGRLAAPAEPTAVLRVGTTQGVTTAPWLRPIASALVPGSGQLMAGHEHGAIYVVAEAFFAIRFFTERAEGRRERDRYIDLAFGVARAPFAPARRDTAFEYYEQMEKFIESGPLDTDPGPALVPPTDERTFNGSLWALARQTFFENPMAPPDPSSPEYQRALEFYMARAVGPNFQWSWRNAGLEQDLFRQSIRRSDEALRQARQQLGLLLANHLLSAVDAFVSTRLARLTESFDVRPRVWTPDRRSYQFLGVIGVNIGI